MIEYDADPTKWITVPEGRVASFLIADDASIHAETVAAFGEEWSKFDRFSDAEIEQIGKEYFDIAGPDILSADACALDLGCGSGRWSRYVASRARFVEAVDPSASVLAAAALTADLENVRVTQASVETLPFPDDSFDFVFSLGVLHHMPDTAAALADAVRKLRPGGWLLVYLYYALDDRSRAYRLAFRASDLLRRVVSRLPGPVKRLSCDVLAVLAYVPLVWTARLVRRVAGASVAASVPLHYYMDKSWHVIRNDALDRFGTPLEKRFSRAQVSEMMTGAGLSELRFSAKMPKWHAVGRKAVE